MFLPAEILRKIVTFVALEDAARLRCVCKDYNEALVQKSLKYIPRKYFLLITQAPPGLYELSMTRFAADRRLLETYMHSLHPGRVLATAICLIRASVVADHSDQRLCRMVDLLRVVAVYYPDSFRIRAAIATAIDVLAWASDPGLKIACLRLVDAWSFIPSVVRGDWFESVERPSYGTTLANFLKDPDMRVRAWACHVFSWETMESWSEWHEALVSIANANHQAAIAVSALPAVFMWSKSCAGGYADHASSLEDVLVKRLFTICSRQVLSAMTAISLTRNLYSQRPIITREIERFTRDSERADFSDQAVDILYGAADSSYRETKWWSNDVCGETEHDYVDGIPVDYTTGQFYENDEMCAICGEGLEVGGDYTYCEGHWVRPDGRVETPIQEFRLCYGGCSWRGDSGDLLRFGSRTMAVIDVDHRK